MSGMPDSLMEKWSWQVKLLKQYPDDEASDEDTPLLFPEAPRAGNQPMTYQVSSAAAGCVVPGSSTDWLGDAAHGLGATMAGGATVAEGTQTWEQGGLLFDIFPPPISKSTQTESSQDMGEGGDNPSHWLWLQELDISQGDFDVDSVVLAWQSDDATVMESTKDYEESFG
jgi:hypothetical protein